MSGKGEKPAPGGQVADEDFINRTDAARALINSIDKKAVHDEPGRQKFFNSVYENAKGDASYVPWADLKEKKQLEQWLVKNNGIKSSSALTAIDVACGLGDNAEALATAGYQTTAFDLSPDAIEWAKRRFPKSKVDYHPADLFALPDRWNGAFDLVHECYTLQALPPETLEKTSAAIASLVKPGGTLLVFTRTRRDGSEVDGPPWPLEEKNLGAFSRLGFELTDDHRFQLEKNGRLIPHAFMQWQKQK